MWARRAGLAIWLAAMAACPSSGRADGLGRLIVPDAASSPAPSASVQSPAISPKPADDATEIAKALAAAQNDVQRLSETGAAQPPGATVEETLERNHLMGQQVDTLSRHRDALGRMTEMRRRAAEQQEAARTWTGFAQQPPYSLLLVDQLREDLETARREIAAAETRRKMIGEASDEAEKTFKAAEVDARQSEERLGREQARDGRDRQAWLLDLARLQSRVAAEDVAEAQEQVALVGVEIAMKQAEAQLLSRQLAVARTSVRFSQTDLDAVLHEVDRQRALLEARAKTLVEQTAGFSRQLDDAQKALSAARAEAPREGETTAQREVRLALLAQWVDLRRRQSDNHDLALEGTQRLLDLKSRERTGWQYRWYLFNGGDAAKLAEARRLIDQQVDQMDTLGRYVEREIALSNGRIGEAELRRKGGLTAAEADLVSRFVTAERDRTDLLREAQQSVEDWRRTLVVWRQEFADRADGQSVGNAFEAWVGAGQRALTVFWNFELFTAEDTIDIDGRKVAATHSITVGKSVGVIVLLLAGYLLTEWILRIVRRLAIGRLGLDAGRTSTVLRWLHAIVLSMLFIVALYTVNIPLTVFAFLGGALAIGVGFGTQVLLKNMISGVMLLIERPLRVGDMIEVGSVVGTVSNISIRSSTVRTSDGIEILVPNATFVENNVTNWTYSNAKVRRWVSVGVDYAAAPDHVSTVLLAVAEAHPDVVADPPPRVLLEEFAAETMNFKLQYWIDYAQGADGSKIASDLRFAMARALATAGISIPLPQRVVYLKTEQ